MKKSFYKAVLIPLISIPSLLIIYITLAFIIPFIPANSNFHPCSENDCVDIYIISNGVHTDITLPINTPYKNWMESLPPTYTKAPIINAQYISFGWGDKGFYLETPTWSDLKFTTAFKAAFFLSSSAMHITYYQELKHRKKHKIRIDHTQYLKIIEYIENSLTQSQNTSDYIPIQTTANYDYNDCFYEANGTYSFIFTCNTWANNALKYAGLKACLWTPFERGIFYQYNN